MVALSVPSLRRILRKMEASGLIETHYARVRVLDRNRLLKLCHDTTQLQGSAGYAARHTPGPAADLRHEDPIGAT
jgi:hypothetical protein